MEDGRNISFFTKTLSELQKNLVLHFSLLYVFELQNNKKHQGELFVTLGPVLHITLKLYLQQIFVENQSFTAASMEVC